MTAARRAVAICGSPASASTSRLLAERVLTLLEGRGFESELIDLSSLPADALLGRAEDASPGEGAVAEALAAVDRASVLVLATPVYRATYTALLKTLFDLMPQGALAGKVSVLIATGYGAGHLLAIDHGLRPLVASLDGLSAATGIYATAEAVVDGDRRGPRGPAVAARYCTRRSEAGTWLGLTNPTSYAKTAACVRSRRSSLPSRRFTCVFTVPSLITNASAISAFE